MLAAATEIRSLAVAFAVVLLVAVTALAYAPGLHGVFVFDSVERVVQNDSLQISALDAEQLLGAAYAAEAGYPQRGLAYVTLALNYYFAGQQFEPFAFKSTNLAIHVLNGLLVLVFGALILSRWYQRDALAGRQAPSSRVAAMAVVVMGLWMLHPIQITSVLYVVQRMTSLAATWVLVGAIAYVLARARFQQCRPYALALMYSSVVVCTGLGFLCKQSALLLPAYVAVLELFVFERGSLSPGQRRGLKWYFGVTLALPLAVGVAALLVYPELILGAYESRDFTIAQRVLTQARVLFFYLGLLLIPDVRRFGLYHDDLVTSSGLFDPPGTIVALSAWILILICIAWGARRRSPWAFAAAWFVVGHAMESTIWPLEQVHEHRNYAPSIGIWIAVLYYAGALWERTDRLRALVLTVLGVWLLSLALISHTRAQAWRSPAALMESLARHHPQSYRSVVGYAFNSVPVSADLSIRFEAFRRAAVLDGGVVVPLIEMAKIASALQRYMESEGMKFHSTNEQADAGSVAEMTLSLDAELNARLLEALEQEIMRRNSTETVRTDNVIALIAFVDCALSGNGDCMALMDNARRWHDAALSNPRLPTNYEAVLELSMAKIYAVSADHEAAVRHARRAGELSADNLTYRLQEATLYAILERWDDLGASLDAIAQRFPVRAKADSTYRDLRDRYGRVMGQSTD
jgi:hypothetical protein